MIRLKGLDSLRFICAIIVVLRHFGGPPFFSYLEENNKYVKIFKALYANTFNGPAAVIVFFVISGLVIHYPFVNGKKLNVLEFYIKRFLRLGIPMIALAIIAYLITGNFKSLGIFWSLYAELIYYALYPIIILLKTRISIYKLISISFLLSYVAIIFYPYKSWNNFVDLGNGLTWLIGLPSWLIGLLLAENVNIILNKPSISLLQLNFIRTGIFVLSILLSIAKFHLNISNTVSLNLFAIPIYFWISKEINYYYKNKVSNLAEWGGTWSFSLYICHIIATIIYSNFNFKIENPFLDWFLLYFTIFLFSYLFFLLIESPSHILIRKIKLKNLDIRSGNGTIVKAN